MRIVKYFDKNGINYLETGKLKFPLLSETNDLFEAHPSFESSEIEYIWNNDIRRNYGLLSFSTNFLSPIMVSHYSKNDGFVAEFEPDCEIPVDGTNIKLSKCLEPANYVVDRPVLGYKDVYEYNEEKIFNIFQTKWLEWSYEMEIRMFVRVDNNLPKSERQYIKFERKSIKSIYLTGEFAETDKIIMLRKTGDLTANIFKLDVSKKKYGFSIEEIAS